MINPEIPDTFWSNTDGNAQNTTIERPIHAPFEVLGFIEGILGGEDIFPQNTTKRKLCNASVEYWTNKMSEGTDGTSMSESSNDEASAYIAGKLKASKPVA